ncbi:MAG: class I SAM-dependent methyltransferase [Armatimonadota bacterium]|nr:class I SAM-dependent methyltransferase [Armatimonadota bacterium]MDR5696509.1 class I SAM-dependent methyltransferase [Armatimonadota bacterium]
MGAEVGSRFTFEKFASHPFFAEVNRWLVEHVGIRRDATVVDLGCGPGAVTEIILEYVDPASGAVVYAIDPSPSALQIARSRIRCAIVHFLEGTAERLSHIVPAADVVLFCNAIHLVREKADVVREVFNVLRRGGAFGFNTTFFEGAYPAETLRFYKLWVLRAVRHLKERGIEVTRGVKATAMRWLGAQDYCALLASQGFTDVRVEIQQKPLSRQSLEDISEFELFIEGALPGVPLAEGCEALKVGVRQAFEELDLTLVPRNWLQVIARRA